MIIFVVYLFTKFVCLLNMEKLIDDKSVENYKSIEGLKILNTNIRSLYKNIEEFKIITMFLRPDIFCITGTWLNSNISNLELAIDGYKIIRRDRTDGRRGGGVCLYYNYNKLSIDLLKSDLNFESIILQIKHNMSKAYKLTIIYKPPETDLNLFYEFFENILKDYSNEEFLIAGDFNLNLLNNENKNFV